MAPVENVWFFFLLFLFFAFFFLLFLFFAFRLVPVEMLLRISQVGLMLNIITTIWSEVPWRATILEFKHKDWLISMFFFLRLLTIILFFRTIPRGGVVFSICSTIGTTIRYSSRDEGQFRHWGYYVFIFFFLNTKLTNL